MYDADELWCPNCKRWVHPEVTTEYQGERPHGGYITYEMCPGCGGEDLMEFEPYDEDDEEEDLE